MSISLSTNQMMPKIMRHQKIVCKEIKRTYWLQYLIAFTKKLESWI